MPVEKKIAAHKAVTKYSANLFSATIEYAKLSGQLPEATSLTDEYPKLKDEMLSLLPQYRYHSHNSELPPQREKSDCPG